MEDKNAMEALHLEHYRLDVIVGIATAMGGLRAIGYGVLIPALFFHALTISRTRRWSCAFYITQACIYFMLLGVLTLHPGPTSGMPYAIPYWEQIYSALIFLQAVIIAVMVWKDIRLHQRLNNLESGDYHDQ